MTKTFCMKLFVMAAVITMCTAVTPNVLSAQTSGVGCDGFTRFMWRGTNSELSLWRIDGNLNSPISHAYGPYDGWVPIAMTTLCDNNTYVLWKYTDGSISIWKVDPNLNYVTSHVFGPYTGWIPESLSPDQSIAGQFRVLWRETMGQVSIWALDSNLNSLRSNVFGPFFGWDPTPSAALAVRAGDRSSTASDPAAEAMKRKATPPNGQ
jgi:hypothetical protein